MEDLTTEIWRLSGMTGSDPGMMSIEGGVVSLHVADNNDNLQCAFSVPVAQIEDVNWPRLQMSGGCNFVVGGEKYRLSFLQPQNTRPLAASYGAAAGIASISGGRKAGKAWKALLASG